jgi:hypothetical protein
MKKIPISRPRVRWLLSLAIVCIVVVVIFASLYGQPGQQNRTRESVIPRDAAKMTPETDVFPPVLHSDEWMHPRAQI